MVEKVYLSKSDFQVGSRCIKRLWQEKKNFWSVGPSATEKKNPFEGKRFNEAVRDKFLNGILVGDTSLLRKPPIKQLNIFSLTL